MKPDPHGIRIKRAYEPASEADGTRILVDRLWPRGLSRERVAIDLWLRDVAPSAELRAWFGHDAVRWDGFQQRYAAELAENPAVDRLLEKVKHGPVTLVYAARDDRHNNAVVLHQVLERRMQSETGVRRPR